jgi:hypothetical protein
MGYSVIICGDRETAHDISIIDEAVKKSGFKIDEVLCGDCRGADKLGEEWANANKIKVRHFPAKWKDLDQEGAVIKERKNFKGKMEKYNSNAGFFRNNEMAVHASKHKGGGGCIAIQTNGLTPGTTDMVKKAKALKLEISVYNGPEDYEYNF